MCVLHSTAFEKLKKNFEATSAASLNSTFSGFQPTVNNMELNSMVLCTVGIGNEILDVKTCPADANKFLDRTKA